MTIKQGTVQLSVDVVFALELFGVSQELKMANWIDVNLVKLQLKTHAIVEIKYLIFYDRVQRTPKSKEKRIQLKEFLHNENGPAHSDDEKTWTNQIIISFYNGEKLKENDPC